MAVDTVKLTRIQRLGFAIETTTGTAMTLDATTAASLVINPDMTPDQQGIRVPYAGFGSSKFIPGAAKATCTFSDYMTGIGSGDGNHSDFLLACGAVNAAGSYSFTHAPGGSATIGVYLDGLLSKAVGAMGNCVMTIRPGEPILREFNFQGGLEADADVAIPGSITDPTLVAPTCVSATITIGGTAYVWDEMKLDLGNQIILRPDASKASGIRSAWIVDRMATLTVSPEAVAVATKNFGSDFRAGTTAAFSAVIGATAGNIVTITGTLAQTRYPGMKDGNGRVVRDLAYEFVNESLVVAHT
jgi:hypothetical protein